ncbi:hypothetical protein [Paracoccus sp. MC1862]|uniref:hypothetical protein n=1 Tax=Paracoccus sp. MC1862 TaxID=2760307 RepID=UPI0016014C72|nr:hypothetical protein [Paracoccus sp. MC1862]MBB1498444.1 hypothetical protein [Paracoccus sp. MC1862]QQO46693.1 hypothetical protein JGR78_17020 [Paracoccus sp. MC1862]
MILVIVRILPKFIPKASAISCQPHSRIPPGRSVPQECNKRETDCPAIASGTGLKNLDEMAIAAALTAFVARRAGLSRGGRCCLTPAKHLVVPALTGDSVWTGIADEIGVAVQGIR